MQKNIYDKFDIIISDTSSISNLMNINKLDLLKDLYNSITITPEILDEYSKRFKEKLPDWITIKEAKNKEKIKELNKDLGLGEASAIAYALENPNTLIIIDDQDAKMYAAEIGLPVIGTIGIIRQAVDRNIIKNKIEANNLFDELRNTGARISDKLLNAIKYPME